MTAATSNPQLYRELSIPFADRESANKALDGFATELEELRKKHKLPDVVTIVQVSCYEGEDEGVATATFSFGDPFQKSILLAMALGKEQARIESVIQKLVKNK